MLTNWNNFVLHLRVLIKNLGTHLNSLYSEMRARIFPIQFLEFCFLRIQKNAFLIYLDGGAKVMRMRRFDLKV